MNWLDRLFHRVPADQVRRDQLFEAERLVVEHHAAAEIHIALAGAYSARVARLRREIAPEPATLRVAK
jgi:hypothetical protein